MFVNTVGFTFKGHTLPPPKIHDPHNSSCTLALFWNAFALANYDTDHGIYLLQSMWCLLWLIESLDVYLIFKYMWILFPTDEINWVYRKDLITKPGSSSSNINPSVDSGTLMHFRKAATLYPSNALPYATVNTITILVYNVCSSYSQVNATASSHKRNH